jgi:hypothetical protein
MTTAEDVKRVLREYADENLPGWECAAASFRVGKVGEVPEEQLVVVKGPPAPPTRP